MWNHYHYDFENEYGYYGGIMIGSWSSDPGGYYGVFMAATEGHGWMQYIGSQTIIGTVRPRGT